MHLIDSLCDGWTTGKDYLQLRFELVFSYASSFSSDASCKDLEGSTEFCQAYSGPVDREAFPDLLPREGFPDLFPREGFSPVSGNLLGIGD